MKQKYLGDSYDAVKRLWQEVFADWAPLYANTRFICVDLQEAFMQMTRIPILDGTPPSPYSILNDPDTGIYRPDWQGKVRDTHISLATICEQLEEPAVYCVVTYDQSIHRTPGLSAQTQRACKLQWLRDRNLHAFYYDSHAPFIFAFSNRGCLEDGERRLRKAGIPQGRIKY